MSLLWDLMQRELVAACEAHAREAAERMRPLMEPLPTPPAPPVYRRAEPDEVPADGPSVVVPEGWTMRPLRPAPPRLLSD